MTNIVYYATYKKDVNYFMHRMVERLSDIGVKYRFHRYEMIIETDKFVVFGISSSKSEGWLPKIDYVVTKDNYSSMLTMKCDKNYKEITEADLYGLIEEWNQYQ